MSSRGRRSAAAGVALALVALALGVWGWPSAPPPAAPPSSAAVAAGAAPAPPDDSGGDPPSTGLSAAPTTVGGEAAQRDGTARPGPALGVGVALREGALEVGRLWPSATRRSALVALWAPDAEGERLRKLAGALRRTRDYHLVTLHGPRAAVGVLAAMAQARALLPSEPSAVALIAIAGPAQDAVAAVAAMQGATALVLVSPRGALEAEGEAFGWLAGRHALLLATPTDGASAPVVAAWPRLPLASAVDGLVRGPGGLELLEALGRPWSDLCGWLFAVLPASER